MSNEPQIAVFAGGCFWGMQDLIRKYPGVITTRVGYAGGATENPRYEDVKTGATGHAESILIEFNPEELSYRKLVEFFFQIHDPTTKDRQGNDVGSQYRSAIFYRDETQKEVAEATMRDLESSGKWPGAIVTELEPAGPFYDAEDFHQDYLERYPNGYTCHFVRPEWFLDGQ